MWYIISYHIIDVLIGYGVTYTAAARYSEICSHDMIRASLTFSYLLCILITGNVWRFPYVIASNGGAAAVVAYLACAVFVAWPLFTFELILGQYLRKTFIKTWETIRPRWLSFGWAQFLLLFIVQSYFSMVITYTLPYIAGSCQSPLPWTGNSEAYWTNTILNSYDNLDDKPAGPGPIQWKLAVSLLVFWFITFFSVAFGKNVLSNITYVTVTLPVVLVSYMISANIHTTIILTLTHL